MTDDDTPPRPPLDSHEDDPAGGAPPVTGSPGSTGSRTGPDEHPDRIDRYEILSVLGKGGMGVVYHARQHDPIERDVALKTIITGMDSYEAIRRFESERQSLARMEHPSIAKVFDAGVSPEGRLYFVMEYVQGVPIGEYCDRHRLDTEARLALFGQICRAVQHAHQKGVIHRDLKPSNLLVTESDGKPLAKVIDFGIAKATGDDDEDGTRLTHAYDAIGTPAYMSPEQIAGAAGVDTRTDVYALGIVLYELLSGTLPYATSRAAGVAGLMERITTDAPPMIARLNDLADTQVTVARARNTTPQSLRKRLSGDLNWIVVKALERDLDRRYESAAALVGDIERHLANEPIEARAPTAGYRLRKFVRRNRVPVAAGVVVMLGLAGGAAAATVGLVRAQRAEAAALLEAETTSRVSDYLVELFDAGSPLEARGREVTAVDLLDRGAERLESSLETDPVVQARLMSTIGRAYRLLGIQDRALALARRSLDQLEEELGPDDPEVATALMQIYDPAETEEERWERVRRVHAIRDARLEPGDSLWRESFRAARLADAGCGLGQSAFDAGSGTLAFCSDSVRFEAGIPALERDLERTIARWGNPSPEAAGVTADIADLFNAARRSDAADWARRAAERFEELGDPVGHANALVLAASVLQGWQRIEEAIETLSEAEAVARASGHPDLVQALSEFYRLRAWSYESIARGTRTMDDETAQREAALRALDEFERGIAVADSFDVGAISMLNLHAQNLPLLREVLPAHEGRVREDLLERSLRVVVEWTPRSRGERSTEVVGPMLELATLIEAQGRGTEADSLRFAAGRVAHRALQAGAGVGARTDFRRAAADWMTSALARGGTPGVVGAAFAELDPDDLVRSDIAHALGNALGRLGRREESVAAWRNALELRARVQGDRSLELVGLMFNIGSALGALEGPGSAEREYLRVLELIGDRPSTSAISARQRIISLLEGTGRDEEIADHYDEIVAMHGRLGQANAQTAVALMQAQLSRALAHAYLGRIAPAREAASAGVELAYSIGRDRANADFVLAVVEVEAGDGAAAADAIDLPVEFWSLPWADTPDWLPWRAHAHAVNGDAHRLKGESAEAVAAYDRALAAFDSIPDAGTLIGNRFQRSESLAAIVARVAEARAAVAEGLGGR